MDEKIKIVYCTPSLYIAGGVERVLTSKANYLAEQADRYDVTIVITDGGDKQPFYHLSDKVHIVNLNIGFEEMWNMSFVKKTALYITKQWRFRQMLRKTLMELRPDITISTLRREINFITSINDGSCKIGEIHINRQNYRNFADEDSNIVKRAFAWWWMRNLVGKLKRLDRFVVLTERDRKAWTELGNVIVIPNPLPMLPTEKSALSQKRVLCVGRYSHEKGIDLLLRAWRDVQDKYPDWRLTVFGAGDSEPYVQLATKLQVDMSRCDLCGVTSNIGDEYLNSSILVCSSRFEGFGMVLLEAMAYGVPVVSFDCPHGPRAIISDGIDGLLAQNGNVSDLANAMSKVMRDDELRRHLADGAVNKARQYDISVIGKQWKNLFDDVLREKNQKE